MWGLRVRVVPSASPVIKNNRGMKKKLYVSVSAYGVEALASSSIGAGGFKFSGLGLQGQSDGYSDRNIFEGSCTEEGKGAGNAIF